MTAPRTLPILPIELPVGPHPGWELDSSEASQDLKSIAESSVIAHSLRQSREKWLLHTFPKFSSKARSGKATDLAPPPHTIQNRGKCDLEIGPHIFQDTVFYEVHYLPPQIPPATLPQSQWQAQNGLPSVQKSDSLNNNVTAASSNEGNTGGSESATSFTAVTPITPTLINQVNSAASSNPILANLLQLAAAGKASPDQLKTLGILIQSLANMDVNATASQTATGTSMQSPSVGQVTHPVREFDLVLDFRETPTERWLFPRSPVISQCVPCRNVPSVGSDILLTTCVPFNQCQSLHDSTVNSKASTDVEEPHKVVIRLHTPPAMVSDTISRWIGDEEKRKLYNDILQKLDTKGPVFLSHQLSPGTLVAQLQNANPTSYVLKPLKQLPTTSRSSRNQRRKQSERVTIERMAGSAGEPSASTKRRQAARQKTSMSSQIRCMTCGQTDVPLILGGRFCRPCVDSGRYTKSDYPLHNPTSASASPLSNTVESVSNTLHPAVPNIIPYHPLGS